MEKEKKEPFSFKIEPSLLDLVRKSAHKNERSVNAQIRFYIKEGLLRNALNEHTGFVTTTEGDVVFTKLGDITKDDS